MGITASSYTLFPDTISCGGEVEGILSLSAGPRHRFQSSGHRHGAGLFRQHGR